MLKMDIRRGKILQKLKDEGIEARSFWKPVHLQKPYQDSPRSNMDNSESLWQRIITIPCSTGITRNELESVVKAVMGSIGYKGYWHMGIRVAHPVKIYKNMKICQIYYYTPVGKITNTYNGSMQNLDISKRGSQYYKLINTLKK